MRKILFLSIVFFLLTCVMAENYISANTYPLCGIVTEISNDTVIVQDYAGNLWTFFGAEDFMPGDMAVMVMNANGTENIADDVIIKVQYGGVYQCF